MKESVRLSAHEEPVEVRTGQLITLGLRSRVIQSGPIGDAEAVVFIHGGPGSADDWRDLLPRVGSFARAVAFDLPGFGEADKPADWEYSPIGWATFVGAALRELGIRRAHLVGNDLGGTSALVWAAAHPESLASAVMICSGIPIGYRWHAIGRLNRVPLIGWLAAATPRRLGFRTVMGRYEPQLPRPIIDRWLNNYDWGTRRALLRFYRSSPPFSVERFAPVLAELNRPALVIWGALNRFVLVEQAERQRESFPSAEVIVLENSRHYPQLDNPVATAAAVIPFLKAQFSSGASI